MEHVRRLSRLILGVKLFAGSFSPSSSLEVNLITWLNRLGSGGAAFIPTPAIETD